MKSDELTYPLHQRQVANLLEAFAEPKKHAKWRFPAGREDYDTFWEAVEALYDYGAFRCPAEELIGVSIRNAQEAKRLNAFVSALNLVLDEVGRREKAVRPAGPYLDHPGWPTVIQTARAALKTFLEPDYEGV